MNNVEIFRFDKHRIGLNFNDGIAKKHAAELYRYAQGKGLEDFTIKRWADDDRWTLIVGKPKTIYNMVKDFRSQGVDYPEGFEDELYERMATVMKEQSTDFISRREMNRKKLSKEENYEVDKIVERYREEGDPKFDEEELENSTWTQEEDKNADSGLILPT